MSMASDRAARWWTWPVASSTLGLLLLMLGGLSTSSSRTAVVIGAILFGAGLIRLLFGPLRASGRS